jgi:hypothetical protein
MNAKLPNAGKQFLSFQMIVLRKLFLQIAQVADQFFHQNALVHPFRTAKSHLNLAEGVEGRLIGGT